jgi:hypothetical protein
MSISLSDLAKLTPGADTVDFEPDHAVSAIFKVSKPGYVPSGVELRSRIDQEMFTGVVRAGRLKELKEDRHVVSVASAQPLNLIK